MPDKTPAQTTPQAPKKIEGQLTVRKGAKVGVVVSRFNDFITSRLVDGAVDAYVRHGGDAGDLTVAYVPGSVELPIVAKRMADAGGFDAIVCLGCVIRGDTSHYDMVVMQAAKGISEAGLHTGVPCVFGVITADTLEQAIDRAGVKHGNNGAKAMLTAIEMINLFAQLPKQ